jgi:serine/threonine protein phosphatase PrpC
MSLESMRCVFNQAKTDQSDRASTKKARRRLPIKNDRLNDKCKIHKTETWTYPKDEKHKEEIISFNIVENGKEQLIKAFMASRQGRRGQLEDEVLCGKMTGMDQLDPDDVEYVLTIAIDQLAEKIKCSYSKMVVGSTLTTAVRSGNKIYAANVGDSAVMVLVKEKYEESFVCHRMTREHNGRNGDERRRVLAAGGFFSPGKIIRIGGKLAMTRAVGDNDLVILGLSSEPEISCMDVPDGAEIYIVAVCDGVTDVLTEGHIAEIFNSTSVKPEDRAKAIRDIAYQMELKEDCIASLDFLGCEKIYNSASSCALIDLKKDGLNTIDNLSVVVAPAEEGVVALVADGHRGADVSKYIERNFKDFLQKAINEKLQSNFVSASKKRFFFSFFSEKFKKVKNAIIFGYGGFPSLIK